MWSQLHHVVTQLLGMKPKVEALKTVMGMESMMMKMLFLMTQAKRPIVIKMVLVIMPMHFQTILPRLQIVTMME